VTTATELVGDGQQRLNVTARPVSKQGDAHPAVISES
jgi:hypothetical protein